jgi:hypothetical protein
MTHQNGIDLDDLEGLRVPLDDKKPAVQDKPDSEEALVMIALPEDEEDTIPNGAPTAAQLTNRSILSDVISFEVRCWGSSPSGDPSQDYDYTQALYQQVIRSVNELTYGSYVCGRGTWTDGRLNDSQLIRDGREFVFTVTLSTPVLERIEALPFAPPNVAPGVTDTLVLSNGQSGPGCEG